MLPDTESSLKFRAKEGNHLVLSNWKMAHKFVLVDVSLLPDHPNMTQYCGSWLNLLSAGPVVLNREAG